MDLFYSGLSASLNYQMSKNGNFIFFRNECGKKKRSLKASLLGTHLLLLLLSMCISAATIDYSTQANIDQVKTTHVHLDWHVDFNRKVISGHVALDLYTLVDHVDKVILDTSYLDIKSVAVNGENAKVNIESLATVAVL